MTDEKPIAWIVRAELEALRERGSHAAILHAEPATNGLEDPLYCVPQQAKLRNLLRQIRVLAEYGTTGPGTNPPCKSHAMSEHEATSLRGSISDLAHEALSLLE